MSKLAKALAAAAGNAGGAEPDPDFNRVSLLLNGNGTDGGQNNTYTDSSTNSFTITKYGDVTQGSISPFGDNWANYFDGNGDYLYTPYTSVLDFGTGDFTVECWVYVTGNGTGSTNYQAIFGSNRAGLSRWSVYRNITNDTLVFFGNDGVLRSTSNTITSNSWVHIAFSRASGTLKGFINGVQGYSDTVTTSYTTNANGFRVGWDDNNTSNHYFEGYISNLRIVKGTAVYTSAFTPSTVPLTAVANTELLTCQSNYFVDNSTNALAFTFTGTPQVTSFSSFANSQAITLAANGGSAYLNGPVNNAYLRTSGGGATFSGDLTAECWVNCNYVDPTAAVILDFRGGTANSNPSVFASSSGLLGMYINNTVYNSGINILNDGQWHHVALVRSSGVYTLYVDGVSTTTASIATSFTAARFQIGADDDGGANAFYGGYISNLRIVNGTALYTSAFTPPTAPLTAISGTELLLNFEDAAIFDYAALSNLSTAGNADISTAVVKYGTGSLAFDGTGDYLAGAANPVFAFGTGDFTIESWVYITASKSPTQSIFDTRNSGPSSTGIVFVINPSNALQVYIGGYILTSSASLSLNTWAHVACVKSNGTITVYIDGVARGSVSNSTNLTDSTPTVGTVVDYRNTGATYMLQGYIDDLRITKGLARYTSTFTPPTAALPTF